MFCPACGAKNPEGASYCVCCGKPLPNTGGGISAETVGHQTHAPVTIEGPSTSSGVLASSPEGIKSFLFFSSCMRSRDTGRRCPRHASDRASSLSLA